MQTLSRLAAIALLVTACAAAGPLTRQVGRDVELTGRLGGPGKEGLYIVTSGETVYLSDYTGPIPIGTNVLVHGKLQWAGDASACPEDSDCPHAARMTHYFVEGAQVRVAP